MTTQIAKSMMSPDIGGLEAGDLSWSARSSKVGWLLCQGQAVSRTVYAALFIAIGTALGVGDGSTTFNLPDNRGRALIGDGTGPSLTARAMGASGGAETHALAVGEIPAHDHAMSYYNQTYTSGAGTMVGGLGSGGLSANTGSKGGGGAHNNMQPFLAANLFIFAGV